MAKAKKVEIHAGTGAETLQGKAKVKKARKAKPAKAKKSKKGGKKGKKAAKK